MFKRIVIKLSGEALAKGCDELYNQVAISRLLEDIVNVKKAGTEITLVIGGGNMWRGRNSDGDVDRVKADQMGMLATVINSIYMGDKIRQKGVKSIVMTPFEVGGITELFSKEKALDYLERGYIIIFAGGVGHPYFSTDTIPALRACELEADCILFAKNVDGVYDKNPAIFADAKRYNEITYNQIIADKLEAIDLTAMIICEENNIDSFVFDLNAPNSIWRACNNDKNFGTKIIK